MRLSGLSSFSMTSYFTFKPGYSAWDFDTKRKFVEAGGGLILAVGSESTENNDET